MKTRDAGAVFVKGSTLLSCLLAGLTGCSSGTGSGPPDASVDGGGGSDGGADAGTCRRYASRSTGSNSDVVTCDFDAGAAELDCQHTLQNTSEAFTFASVSDFIDEVAFVGNTRMRTHSFPSSGVTTSFLYDSNQRITTVTTTFGGMTTESATSNTWDSRGRVTVASLTEFDPSGSGSSCGGIKWTHTYNESARTHDSTFDGGTPTGATGAQLCAGFSGTDGGATYDLNGNVVQTHDRGVVIDYTVNATRAVCK